MANTILHRGPDAEGVFVDPHTGLAQRRLSIIDLADRANPPLVNEDGTIRVIFNGNYTTFSNCERS
jgi:asparagine synthase (glutamine-hydrolysing)